MKKYRIVLAVAVFGVAVGLCSLVLGINTAQAATRTTANSNLTSAGNVRNFLEGTRPGYLSYYKGSNLLYHPNAGAGWHIIPNYGTSGLLTRSNDGSNDERNQCVDIDNSGFRFDSEIWANRGDGCGSNGTTTSYYVGGRVRFRPPNGVPVFLWVRDVDGLDGRQHITFSASAIDDIYIPNTNRSFDVAGGDDLISNGGFCDTQSDGKCNAIVLLRADEFYIKAGMRDGNSRILVDNGALAQYRTLTLNPNGGTVTESPTPPSAVLWSHVSSANLLREYEYNTSAGAYPVPTRSGYTFLGWYDAASGGNRVSSRSMSSDETLYAHWQLIPTWDIGGSVTAYSAASGGTAIATAAPGQTVYFDYRLWNAGPSNSGNITYTTNGAVGNGSPRSLTAGQNIAARSSLEAVAIPANAPIGATYCRTLAWNPDTQAGGSGSAPGCVTVSYNYNLTPTVGLSGNSTVSQGETVRFMTTVGKSVQYPSNQTSWEIRRVIIPLAAVGNFSGLYGANRERSGAGFDGEFSCAWYVARGAECQEGAVLANLPDIGGGVSTSGTQIFVNNLTNVGRTDGYPEVVDAPLGTRICYALMVNSRDRDANNYREFMNCAVVAKHPALQVMNGDVRVGGNFTSGGACTLPITGTIDSGVGGNSNSILSVLMHNYGVDSTTRGSYGDYAATAPGLISRFGSGGLTYSNPSGVVAGKMLLFGSEGAAASSGNYASGANGFFHIASGISTLSSSTPTYCLPDLASNYNQPAATILATPLRDAETTNGSRRYVFNGSNQTLNIQATELTASQRTVIWVENNPTQPNAVNTVRIAGDITLPTGNINSVDAVPQFILIVNGNIDIKINENVASVYGVYSTRGSIYTCGDFDGRVAMTDANCTTTLRVNGALIAGQRVLPYRTAGYNSVTDGTYAETFNLHPGVLVSDYVRARSNGSTFVTDYQQELPTRL